MKGFDSVSHSVYENVGLGSLQSPLDILQGFLHGAWIYLLRYLLVLIAKVNLNFFFLHFDCFL